MMPFLRVNDVDVFLPVDLPEGGQLQIIVGASPIASPSIRMDLPRGCMVALFTAAAAIAAIPQLRDHKLPPEARAGVLQDLNFYGIVIAKPVWIPEGGYLNVRVGLDPKVLPQPSTPIENGALVGVIGPEQAEPIRANLKLVPRVNPYSVIPNGADPG